MQSNKRSIAYQYSFGLTASLAAMSIGIWVSWPSSSNDMLTNGSQTIIMTESQISTMVALMDMGDVVSRVPTGYLMDAVVRKPTIILANICSIIASCLVLFVTEVWMINTARFLVGLAQCITFAVLPIYLMEVASTKIRGGLSTMLMVLLVSDILVLFFVLIFFLLESPYYYLMKGNKYAERAANRIVMTSKVEDDMNNRGRFIDLWTYPTNKRALIVISVLGFFERDTGLTSVTAYSTTTMPSTGGGLSPYDYMILYAIVGIMVNYIVAVLVDIGEGNFFSSLDFMYCFNNRNAGLAAMPAGAWLSWPSSVVPQLKDGSLPVTMTVSEISTMVALMDLGNVLSPVPASYLMDIIGRKPTLIISGIFNIIASLLVLSYTNIWMIYTARIFAGLSKGITFAVVPIYLAEISNKKIRGGLSTMFIGFLNIGMLYDYVIGPSVSYIYLNIANLIIPLIFICAILFFPESPPFLIMQGKDESARSSLSKYGQIKRSSTRSNELEAEFSEIANKVEAEMKQKGRFIDLVTTSSSRRALLIVALLAFFQRSSGISPTIAYSTSVMPEFGGGMSRSNYMILFSVLLVLANYLPTFLVDNLGRKPLLIISSLTTAFVTGLASLYYFLERNTSIDVSVIAWIPYACLICFAITYSLGIGFLPSTLVGELFPTNIKCYASSVSAMILAIVSFTINRVFHAVSENFGTYVMYWYFTLSCILCAIFVYFFVFETRGKTLGEIQEYLVGLDNKTKAIVV